PEEHSDTAPRRKHVIIIYLGLKSFDASRLPAIFGRLYGEQSGVPDLQAVAQFQRSAAQRPFCEHFWKGESPISNLFFSPTARPSFCFSPSLSHTTVFPLKPSTSYLLSISPVSAVVFESTWSRERKFAVAERSKIPSLVSHFGNTHREGTR